MHVTNKCKSFLYKKEIVWQRSNHTPSAVVFCRALVLYFWVSIRTYTNILYICCSTCLPTGIYFNINVHYTFFIRDNHFVVLKLGFSFFNFLNLGYYIAMTKLGISETGLFRL